MVLAGSRAQVYRCASTVARLAQAKDSSCRLAFSRRPARAAVKFAPMPAASLVPVKPDMKAATTAAKRCEARGPSAAAWKQVRWGFRAA